MDSWTIADSERLYRIPGWGQGMFRVNKAGHLQVNPTADPKGPAIDLKRLVDDMRKRGLDLPLLVRFTDVIRTRVDAMVGAFSKAIQEWDYQGRYRPVFPIKVNPQSHVMHDVMAHGRPHHVGMEAGSKPELMAVLATMDDLEALIICNGYKDRQYIRMALLARQLGHECVIVLEKPGELDLVLEVAEELEIEPIIGMRARLSAEGRGHWSSSTGDTAKFGLDVNEVLDVVERLRSVDKLSCLQLLHFHIGSQIPEVRTFRGAVREAVRMYSELRRLGAGMRFLDVGGGLGVDYDGTASTDTSSVNYNVREYANAIVGSIYDVCAESGCAHPDIVTEAGRAMVAHHAVLLLDVLGSTTKDAEPPPRPPPGQPVIRQVEAAWEIHDDVRADSWNENLHDIQALRREATTRFNLGLLNLEQRAYIERLYWATCAKILDLAPDDSPSDDVQRLQRDFVDLYFCNFSVFQSTPDVWAIEQLFPIVPIQRLGEEPRRHTVLADLTCDSDGKINKFIGERTPRPFLPLHHLKRRERYTIGVFLVGAYQEILGDLHNLFGDTHAIHVQVADNANGYTVLHLDEGDIIEEVLGYVHHNAKQLVKRLRDKVEEATDAGRMAMEDGAALIKTFQRGLDDYTYLNR
ncbi:MAG TPA: biosynthetic arginine decarboxylase [Myxococcota bacterium]|nr:biosynthetic arginine decarboxylase [Myxococcota bacterium]